MGSDFAYENGFVAFGHMDRLIRGVNADGRVAALFSTPAMYAAAKIRDVRLPARSDDMFPIADSPHAREYASRCVAVLYAERAPSRRP